MQEDNNNKKTTKRRLIIIAALALIIALLLLLHSCGVLNFSNSNNVDNFNEIDLSEIQKQIDDICSIELKEENYQLIKLRIEMVDDILSRLTPEQIAQLDLSEYEKLKDYIKEIDEKRKEDELNDNDDSHGKPDAGRIPQGGGGPIDPNSIPVKDYDDGGSSNDNPAPVLDPNKVRITTSVNSKSAGSVAGQGIYDKNTEVTLEATPASNAIFLKWGDGSTENPRTFTATESKDYKAYFGTISTLTTSVNHEEMGSVTEGGQYITGTRANLEATPNPNYEFVNWSDGGKSNPRTVNVDKNKSYVANFQFIVYTISTPVNDERMGTVTGGGKKNSGSTVTLTAVPNEDYKFVKWEDGSTENPRTETVTGDATYKAIFTLITYDITWDTRGISSPSFATSTATIKQKLGSIPTVADTSDYKFVGWFSESSDVTHTGGEEVTVDTIATADTTYYAVFAHKQTVYRSQRAQSQGDDNHYVSTGNSSCAVPDYPEYYVNVTVPDTYLSWEVVSYREEDDGYHCHVYDFDGCSWTTCSNESDEWDCCCGRETRRIPVYGNVTRDKTCPAYYEITSWGPWSDWEAYPITEKKAGSSSFAEVVKVETTEMFVYNDSIVIE